MMINGAKMSPGDQKKLVEAIQSDPGFRAEMAALAAEPEQSDGSGAAFTGWEFCGRHIAAPGPRVWRWLDIANSPLAPGGDFASLTDADLVLALRVICEGRDAIKPYLSLPARQRRATDARAMELAETAEAEAIEGAYNWADQFDATIQEIADIVVEVLQASAPIAIKKNCNDAPTNG